MDHPAIKALKLFDIWHNMPADRGGPNGPRGKAWTKFVKAKEKAYIDDFLMKQKLEKSKKG